LIPVELDVAEAYAQGKDSDQVFISNLAQFLVAFLKEHTDLVEDTNRDASAPVAAMRQQVQAAHLLVRQDLCTNRYSLLIISGIEIFAQNLTRRRSGSVQDLSRLLVVAGVRAMEGESVSVGVRLVEFLHQPQTHSRGF
jgi:hypothetical protein